MQTIAKNQVLCRAVLKNCRRNVRCVRGKGGLEKTFRMKYETKIRDDYSRY